jgi:hypothetical protein
LKEIIVPKGYIVSRHDDAGSQPTKQIVSDESKEKVAESYCGHKVSSKPQWPGQVPICYVQEGTSSETGGVPEPFYIVDTDITASLKKAIDEYRR